MFFHRLALSLTLALGAWAQTPRAAVASPSTDPTLYLEDLLGEKSLAWVKARNEATLQKLTQGTAFQTLRGTLLRELNSESRLPTLVQVGGHLYNFWKDAAHPLGIWRRTPVDEFAKADPAWETLLDLDALALREKENWVWGDAQILPRDGTRALVSLSRGGADAVVVREFDLPSRRFVEDGFNLKEAKGNLSWIDRDHVYVATDFGKGSLTEAGYPRLVKLWTRGKALKQAPVVFRGQVTDYQVGGWRDATPGFERDFLQRDLGFFATELYLRRKEGRIQKVPLPSDALPTFHREWMTVELRSPWKVGGKAYRAGCLLAIPFEDFLAGRRDFHLVFEPTQGTSIAATCWTRHHLVITTLEHVKNRVWIFTPGPKQWSRQPLKGLQEMATAAVQAVDAEHSNEIWITEGGFLTPPRLLHGNLGTPLRVLKATAERFETGDLAVTQHFATSKDGTQVPYFQIGPKHPALDGRTPTLLWGYGGFEESQLPTYLGLVGPGWLRKGGIYVVANIRGGAEYGPAWHQGALKEKRPRAYEDFAAVAEDLVKRRVTSPKHLGAIGASNGGLLMGNMLTRYPDHFGALVAQVPLLDMQRYTKLLAGAAWIDEYGDPDKSRDWAYLKGISPIHNLKPGVTYPPTLFLTNTRDDRVHPGHARRMVEKLAALGADVSYFENTEGGHGQTATAEQRAHMSALAFTFLWERLR